MWQWFVIIGLEYVGIIKYIKSNRSIEKWMKFLNEMEFWGKNTLPTTPRGWLTNETIKIVKWVNDWKFEENKKNEKTLVST